MTESPSGSVEDPHRTVAVVEVTDEEVMVPGLVGGLFAAGTVTLQR
jgi:hypothetical protein